MWVVWLVDVSLMSLCGASTKPAPGPSFFQSDSFLDTLKEMQEVKVAHSLVSNGAMIHKDCELGFGLARAVTESWLSVTMTEDALPAGVASHDELVDAYLSLTALRTPYSVPEKHLYPEQKQEVHSRWLSKGANLKEAIERGIPRLVAAGSYYWAAHLILESRRAFPSSTKWVDDVFDVANKLSELGPAAAPISRFPRPVEDVIRMMNSLVAERVAFQRSQTRKVSDMLAFDGPEPVDALMKFSQFELAMSPSLRAAHSITCARLALDIVALSEKKTDQSLGYEQLSDISRRLEYLANVFSWGCGTNGPRDGLNAVGFPRESLFIDVDKVAVVEERSVSSSAELRTSSQAEASSVTDSMTMFIPVERLQTIAHETVTRLAAATDALNGPLTAARRAIVLISMQRLLPDSEAAQTCLQNTVPTLAADLAERVKGSYDDKLGYWLYVHDLKHIIDTMAQRLARA